MRRVACSTFLAVVALALLPGRAPVAAAAWTANGSGGAAGAATVMPAGATSVATPAGTTVTVTWPAATLASGTAVAGYVVQRFDALNGAPATVGGTCNGVVAATSCSESVPAGSWFYTDTPVQLTWTGSASPSGNVITVP